MNFAVVRINGYQYLVQPGDRIVVPARIGKDGDDVSFDDVLLYRGGDEMHIGRPVLDDVKVKARIVRVGRMDKVMVFKYKRRKNYRRLKGHRQDFSEVLISEIVAG